MSTTYEVRLAPPVHTHTLRGSDDIWGVTRSHAVPEAKSCVFPIVRSDVRIIRCEAGLSFHQAPSCNTAPRSAACPPLRFHFRSPRRGRGRPKRRVCSGICGLLGVPASRCADRIGAPCPDRVINDDGSEDGCGQGNYVGQGERELYAKFIFDDEPWKEFAACRGHAPTDKRRNPKAVDPWFPETGQSVNLGKLICKGCHVREQCKDYRDRTESKEGIWGAEIISRKNKKKSA